MLSSIFHFPSPRLNPSLLLLAFILIFLFSTTLTTTSTTVTLSNTELPRDNHNEFLITGESSSMYYDNYWYFYFNNWGGCAGVNCCDSDMGCQVCCFSPPSKKYPDSCVYALNHTFVAYRTSDFVHWENLGVVLTREARHEGIAFRPHVVLSPKLGLFMMWFCDRHSGQKGFSLAVSENPWGPFKEINDTIVMATGYKDGDFDILIDDDGKAYIVRTGMVIEELNAEYNGPSGRYYAFGTAHYAEGPVFFKRNGIYYVIDGKGCCACKGGTTMDVWTSRAPLGPYVYQGDIGSNQTAPYDRHSPYNFVTRAQGSHLFRVPSKSGESTYVWYGNQWVSNPEKWPARNHDLLYFWPLQFEKDGNITHVEYAKSIQFEVGV